MVSKKEHIITDAGVQKALQPVNWELTAVKDRKFTSDHVIDAYFEGKSAGLQQAEQLIMKSLIENINKAGEITAELLNFMRAKVDFHPISTHMKINSWSDFQVLIILPTNEFLDKKIFEVYNKISEVEDSSTSEFFNVVMSICNTNEPIDEVCITSDGYNLKHKM